MNSWERWDHRATTRLESQDRQTPPGEKGQSAGFPGAEPRRKRPRQRASGFQPGVSESAAECEGVPPGHLRQAGCQGRQHKMSKETPAATETKRVLNETHQRDTSREHRSRAERTPGVQTGATANRPWKDAQHR